MYGSVGKLCCLVARFICRGLFNAWIFYWFLVFVLGLGFLVVILCSSLVIFCNPFEGTTNPSLYFLVHIRTVASDFFLFFFKKNNRTHNFQSFIFYFPKLSATKLRVVSLGHLWFLLAVGFQESRIWCNSVVANLEFCLEICSVRHV